VTAGAGALADQVVLITGAARGIGEALARAFAGAGARVAVCDIDTAGAHAVCATLRAGGADANVWELDVRDRAAWHRVVADIASTWGPVDVLIGNAGIMPVGPVLDVPESVDRRQVDINLHGVIHGVHAVLPAMVERRSGRIVNIASLAGRIATPFAGVYAATKFGVVGFTEALRHELLGTGVEFTLVMPGFVETELITGLGRPAWPAPSTPDQVAQAVLRSVVRGKRWVYLPWFGGLLALLPWIMPFWLSVWIARLTRVDRLLKPVDSSARLAYRRRAIEE
jgi:NAD(P)-dependent dehydrogenase (short-subunit alcohol dehydrogenase family)